MNDYIFILRNNAATEKNLLDLDLVGCPEMKRVNYRVICIGQLCLHWGGGEGKENAYVCKYICKYLYKHRQMVGKEIVQTVNTSYFRMMALEGRKGRELIFGYTSVWFDLL